MQDTGNQAQVGEEVPILFNFPPYGYKRFRCPADGQPLENRTREYSTFGVGTYRCLGGHEWTRDSDSLWTREEEDALSRQLAEMRTTLDTAAASLYHLEACISQVLTEQERMEEEREKAFDAVADAIRDAREVMRS